MVGPYPTTANRFERQVPMNAKGETSKTILVVDDEPDLVIGIRATLEAAGYAVLEASNGIQALPMIEAQKPDLVVLDVLMPGMDGWETLRRIQENEDLQDIPVLMLTALDAPENLKQGIDLGCTFYYTKPVVDYDEFLLVVRRVLESR